MRILATAFCIGLALAGLPAMADQSLAVQVADGLPWNATTPEGRKVTITCFPDGTVKMKMGMMRMSMNWNATSDGLCLTGGPMGTRCMKLFANGNGFDGDDGTGRLLILRR